MKRLTSFVNLLVFLALSAPVVTPQSLPDWRPDKLVGSVRTIQVEFAEDNEVDGKLVETKRWPNHRVTYDEKGREVERVTFNEYGTENGRHVIRYDSQGNIMGYEEGRYHSTMEYDSKGNRTAALMYDGDVIQTREVYTYDDKGRKIEESRIEPGGTYHQRVTYAYNAAGQLTETATYFSETLRGKQLNTYNEAGKLVKEESIDYQLNRQASTVEYSYDKSGREIERYVDTDILWTKVQTQYDTNGLVAQRTTHMAYKRPDVGQSHAPKPGRVTYRYNDRGQILEEANYGPDEALINKVVLTYDKEGKLIEEAHAGVSVDPKVSYEYDSHGNWVKRATPAVDPTGRRYIFVEHRTITYY